MEVILLEDIADLGKKYDTVEVADGYGMNYLLPKGKARTATDRAKAQIKEKKEKLEAKRKARREELAQELDTIDGERIKFTRNANDHGNLFAGINTEELSDAVTEEFDIDIEPEFITLPQPIKQVGVHEVEVEIEGETAVILVDVSAE